MVNVQSLFAKLLYHLLFLHNRKLWVCSGCFVFAWLVVGIFLGFLFCFALFRFQKQNQSKHPNRFTEPHHKCSRKTIGEKYPVKGKLQLFLALYLHNRCNFVYTAVLMLENKFLTMIFCNSSPQHIVSPQMGWTPFILRLVFQKPTGNTTLFPAGS